jgi:hypothetical protein
MRGGGGHVLLRVSLQVPIMNRASKGVKIVLESHEKGKLELPTLSKSMKLDPYLKVHFCAWFATGATELGWSWDSVVQPEILSSHACSHERGIHHRDP